MQKQVNMQTKNKTMKIKRTFFNSRNESIYSEYEDINNYLFIIFFNSGAELSFILRDLKENKNLINYIYKKLHKRFDNIMEIETSRISNVEYNLMKQKNIHSVVKIC
mgnify:CR=1 FL=1